MEGVGGQGTPAVMEGKLKATLGTLLIAAILNTFLYGIVSFQYASYYTAQFKDPRWIRWTISGLFVTDAFHSISIIYLVWVHLVDGFGVPGSHLFIHWPIPVSILVGGLTALVVQLFLCYRIFLLSKIRVVLGFMVFLSISLFTIAVTSTVRVAYKTTRLDRDAIDDTLLTVWKPLEALLDLLIAGMMWRVMWSAARETQSNRIVKRLARMSVQTGLCSAIFAVLVMALWLTNRRTNFHLLFAFPISRVYTSTLLDTLISRPKLRAMISSHGSTRVSGAIDSNNAFRPRPDSQFRGLQHPDIVSNIKFESVYKAPERLSSRGNTEMAVLSFGSDANLGKGQENEEWPRKGHFKSSMPLPDLFLRP